MAWLRMSVCVALFVLALSGALHPVAAARSCIHSWAVPGDYLISGNFRGSVESATVHLSQACRVIITLPGIFGGTPVRPAGRCLAFDFKVSGERQVFTARWCHGYGIVPWGGRAIRASVHPKPGPTADDWSKKQNFKSRF